MKCFKACSGEDAECRIAQPEFAACHFLPSCVTGKPMGLPLFGVNMKRRVGFPFATARLQAEYF
jgi:hypothetical protein